MVRQAGLGPNPRLFVQSEDWRPWDSTFDFGSQTEDYAFLSQTFETGGKRRKRTDLAKSRLLEAQSQEQVVRLAITGRVASAYWSAVVARRTVTVLTEDMQAVNEMVRYHQERVAAGAMPGVDLLRMQIERDRLRMTLSAAQRDAAQAELELWKTIGREPQKGTELTDSVDQVEVVPPAPMEEVLAKRADLQKARDAVRTAQADLALQHANGVPNFDLVGGYKRNSAVNTGYGAFQIDLPFRNRNQGEIARAEAGLRLAQNQLQLLDVQARLEVQQSEAYYRDERELVENVLPEMRAAAKQNLNLIAQAYRIGGVDLLRFLDAERTEFDVEVNALKTYAELQQAALRLRLSYGVEP